MLIKNLKVKFPKIKYISIGSGKEENNLIKLKKELKLENDSVVNFFNNDNFLTYGKNAKNFSERFHWDKVVKNYLKLIN